MRADQAIREYCKEFYGYLKGYHISYQDRDYGTYIQNGLERWIIEYQYLPDKQKIQVMLFHSNLFCSSASRKTKYPDYHLQFKQQMNPGELAGYIYTHSNKYQKCNKVERMINEL